MLRATIKRIKRIWTKVPEVHCTGACYQACTNVPVLPAEAEYIEQKYNVQLPMLPTHLGWILKTLGPAFDPCPFLVDRRCSIYEDRPFMCRAFGHDIDTLGCPHGCTVARELPASAFQGMVRDLINVNGNVPIPSAIPTTQNTRTPGPGCNR